MLACTPYHAAPASFDLPSVNRRAVPFSFALPSRIMPPAVNPLPSLIVGVLVPCVDPKFVPVITTDVPTAPDVGFRLVIVGADVVTVKATPLLATPFTFTTTFPVVAPLGTGTAMLVALQLVTVAVVPLNVTVLVPCVDPKFVPVITTDVPTAPDVCERLVIPGDPCKL